MVDRPKIAILGLHLESNRFAPTAFKSEFKERCLLYGDELLIDSRSKHPKACSSLAGFVREMDKIGSWRPAPLVYADGGAAGPIDHKVFLELKEDMALRLRAAMPVDGVYFAQHGAALSTEHLDPDGELYGMTREIVGPDIPIVSILDLHAIVSERMVEMADVMVSYRTNPHVDQLDRGAECAHIIHELMGGVVAETAFIRLPILTPQVKQLTDEGLYAEAIQFGQRKIDDVVMNISILGGFSYGDTPFNGMSFLVTTRNDVVKAQEICKELAEYVWRDRAQLLPTLIPLEECIDMAVAQGKDISRERIIIADVGDNPGGGGRGNTIWLLKGLYEAEAQGVVLGVFFDSILATEAHERGTGAKFMACFNRAETDKNSGRFEAEAEVLYLSDGQIVGRTPGTKANTAIDLGPTAVLRLGTVTVVVISIREQCFDPGFFEEFGIDVEAARTTVVKSRGHFRAGFSVYFRPDQVIECDAPGLTSPNLKNFDWQGLKRPIYPIDLMTDWTPPAW